jgi:hypothetical protein
MTAGDAEVGSYASAEASAGWARGAAERAQYMGSITDKMLEMAGVQRGSRVLEQQAWNEITLAVETFLTTDGVVVPGELLIAAGRK